MNGILRVIRTSEYFLGIYHNDRSPGGLNHGVLIKMERKAFTNCSLNPISPRGGREEGKNAPLLEKC